MTPDVKLAARHHRERHKRYGLPGDPVIDDELTWEAISAKTSGACVIRGCIDVAEQVGHIQSVAAGGDFVLGNLAPICAEHNRVIGSANITEDMMDGGEIEDGEALVWDVVREKMMTSGIDRTGALISTVYALASWHMSAFATVGIIGVTGPAGSGKSAVMKIDAAIGNAERGQIIGAMPSDAALRDQINAGRLLVVDEIKKPSEMVAAMLNSGYARDQAMFPIKVAKARGGFTDEWINLFGPRVVGGAYMQLAPDTMTRVIMTRLESAPHDPEAPKGWEAMRRRDQLRERAVRWARQTRGAIPQFDLAGLPDHITGRAEEVWGPLIKTAEIISEKLGEDMREVAEEYVLKNGSDAPRSARTVWHSARIFIEEKNAGNLTESQGQYIRAGYLREALIKDPDLEYEKDNLSNYRLKKELEDFKALPDTDRHGYSIYRWDDWAKSSGSGGGLRAALYAVMDQHGDQFPNVVVVD